MGALGLIIQGVEVFMLYWSTTPLCVVEKKPTEFTPRVRYPRRAILCHVLYISIALSKDSATRHWLEHIRQGHPTLHLTS